MVTIQNLREKCQPNKGRSWSEAINRRISIYITRALIATPVSANHVTLASIGLTGLAAVTFVLWCDPVFWILGVVLYQIAYTLDYVDGEIARYRATSSLSGLYLDRMASTVNDVILFIGLFWGIFLQTRDDWVLMLGIGCILGVLFPRVCMGSVYQTALEGILRTSNVEGTQVLSARKEGIGVFPTLDSIAGGGGILKKVAWFQLGEGKILFLIFAVLGDFLVFHFGETEGTIFFLRFFLFYYGIIMLLAGLAFCSSILRKSQTEALYSHLKRILENNGQIKPY